MGNLQSITEDLEQVERMQRSLQDQITSLSYVCSQNALIYISKLHTTVQDLNSTIVRIKARIPKKKLLDFKSIELQKKSMRQDQCIKINPATSYNLSCFHEKHASFPKNSLFEAFEDADKLLDGVEKLWFPDLLRREYFGDVFNTLTIKNEAKEFHVLLVFDNTGFELVSCEGLKNGYTLLKAPHMKHKAECDHLGHLIPTKFLDYFRDFLRKVISNQDHRYATLVCKEYETRVVMYRGKGCQAIWYSVVVVPCYEFKNAGGPTARYIPTPRRPSEIPIAWRRTFCVEETQLFREIGNEHEEDIKVVRTVKAMLQLNPANRFSSLLVDNITCVLFHTQRRSAAQQPLSFHQQVLQFLQNLSQNLKDGEQRDYFDNTINLLEGVHLQTLKSMYQTLDKIIVDDNEFSNYIVKLSTSASSSTTSAAVNIYNYDTPYNYDMASRNRNRVLVRGKRKGSPIIDFSGKKC